MPKHGRGFDRLLGREDEVVETQAADRYGLRGLGGRGLGRFADRDLSRVKAPSRRTCKGAGGPRFASRIHLRLEGGFRFGRQGSEFWVQNRNKGVAHFSGIFYSRSCNGERLIDPIEPYGLVPRPWSWTIIGSLVHHMFT